MKKMHISFLLVALALSGCMVSIRPDAPVGAPADPVPPPPEVVETPVAPVEVVEKEPAPEIVFYQPVYYPPPVVVGYRYDHWMYVPNGAFVDIVFIDHYGVRHVEPWRHAGVRMTLAHLPEWHRSYQVPRRALQIHNERLKEYAIKHPGSVKHPPGPAIKPTNLPVNKMGEPPVQTRHTPPPVKETKINSPGKPVEPKSKRAAKEPTTVPEKPTKEVKQGTTVQQKPAIASKQTKTVQQTPTTVPEKPTKAGKQSTSVQQKPTTVPEKPTTRAKQSTTVEQKPAKAPKPPATLQEKPATAAKAPATEKQPTTVQEKETKQAKKPTAPAKKSTTPEKTSDSDSK